MPHLESAIKEALRLHPPLILLLRVAKEDARGRRLHHRGRPDGGDQPGGVQPDRRGLPRRRRASVPARYLAPRQEDRTNPWTWIPFGAGRHRCVGRRLRHDAAQGHLLGAPARTGSSSWPSRPTPTATTTRRWWSSCHSPARCATGARPRTPPHRDGGTLMRVVGRPRPLPGSRGLRVGGARASSSWARTPQVTILDDAPGRGAPGRGRGGRPLLPDIRAAHHRGGVSPCRHSHAGARRDDAAVAGHQPAVRGAARLGADGRHVHRGRHLRMERRAQRRVHGRRTRRDP